MFTQRQPGWFANAEGTAAQIIEKAHKAIPGIVKELDSTSSPTDTTLIFDPKLRQQMQQARRQQSERDALLRELGKQPEVEVLAKSDNYIKIRMHGQCWRVPVSHGYDPFDVRIMQLDTNCPRPKLKLIEKRPDPIRLP